MVLVYVKIDLFMFSFDLYVVYYYVEMFYFYEFLGFLWVVNGKQKFFKFLVLLFGLKLVFYIYVLIKIIRFLLKKWRGEEKCIVMYLDDGIGLGRMKVQVWVGF